MKKLIKKLFGKKQEKLQDKDLLVYCSVHRS